MGFFNSEAKIIFKNAHQAVCCCAETETSISGGERCQTNEALVLPSETSIMHPDGDKHSKSISWNFKTLQCFHESLILGNLYSFQKKNNFSNGD